MELIHDKNKYGVKKYKLKDIECNNSKIEVLVGDKKIFGDHDVMISWFAGQENVVPSQFDMQFTKEEIKEIYEVTLNN